MTLDVYNTHMELYPYKKDDYPILEDKYSVVGKIDQKIHPCGYLIENGKLYLPRGTSISFIESLTGCVTNYIKESDPSEIMSKNHSSLYDPRDDLQKDSIKFLQDEYPQLGLNLGVGKGKTFCVAYTTTLLDKKTLIITPNEGIKQQWINTYFKMFDYKAKHLMNIAGSNIIDGIMNDMYEEADVYFVNHQTLHSYLMNNNGFIFHQFMKKLKIGIKVYDESHMQFGNILLIDFFSNTERTWYLTATFDRSDVGESACFKRAFQSVITYGKIESEEATRKHIVYHTVNMNSRIDIKNRAWLMSHPGFTAIKYGQYAFLKDEKDSAYHVILEVLKKIKDVEGKILIFVPIIDAAEEVYKKLKKDFPEKTYGMYHSKISASEKEVTLNKKDVIISTIKSCGTGKDIPGLRCVICAEPVASKVVIEQTMGRLRPYAPDKDTYFFDIVDRSIPPCTWWHRGRIKKILTMAKQIVELNI